MSIDYPAVFLIGFLGSFGHCIGMCGGFVMAYSIKINQNQPASKAFFISPHLLYNIGRVITYTFLGLLFGLVGETLGVRLGLISFQGTLQIIAGLLMIWMGLDFGGWIPPLSASYFPGYTRFKQLIGSFLRKVNRKNVLGLGLILGFIPCGLVYAAGAKAAAAESALGGMLTMLVFGIGTIPGMLMMGIGANFVTVKFRQRLFRLATILVILLGAFTIYKGVRALTNPIMHHTADIQCCPEPN